MDQYSAPAEPRSLGEIIRRSFGTYLRNFRSFAIFTLLINGVYMLAFFALEHIFTVSGTMNAGSFADLLEGGSGNIGLFGDWLGDNAEFGRIFDIFGELSSSMQPAPWVRILSFAATFFIVPLVLGGISLVSTGRSQGKTHTPTEWLNEALSKYKTLFVANFCSVLFMTGASILLGIVFLFLIVLFIIIALMQPFAGILLILAAFAALLIASLFLAGVYHMSYPAVILEGLTGFSPIFRALRLGFPGFWRTVGTVFTVNLITGVISFVISLSLRMFSDLSFSALLLSLLVGNIVSLFLDPLVRIAMNLNFLSLRSPSSAEPSGIEGPGDDIAPQGPELL